MYLHMWSETSSGISKCLLGRFYKSFHRFFYIKICCWQRTHFCFENWTTILVLHLIVTKLIDHIFSWLCAWYSFIIVLWLSVNMDTGKAGLYFHSCRAVYDVPIRSYLSIGLINYINITTQDCWRQMHTYSEISSGVWKCLLRILCRECV